MLKRAESLTLFLTTLFLPTQLGKHFWPTFSFIYSLPIDYLSPTLYFWDLLVSFLWVIFLIRKQTVNRKALNLFLLFILTQLLSLFSPLINLGAGLVRLEQYLIAGLFGIYIASCHISSKKVIYWALVCSVAAESFLAIAQLLRSGTLGFWILGERSFSLTTPGIAKFDFEGRQFLRPYATLPHPNVLAAYMILSAMILRIRALSFLTGFITLLTVSRSAIAVGFIPAMVLVKGQARWLILLSVIVLSPILYTRFSSIFNFDNLTFIRREELSKVAVGLWLKSPMLGIGLNNFIPSAQDLLLSGPARFLQPVHNIFLLALSETGVIGLLGWLCLLGFPILKNKGWGLCWLVIILLGLFDHYFLTLAQGYRLLFFIWGLSFMLE